MAGLLHEILQHVTIWTSDQAQQQLLASCLPSDNLLLMQAVHCISMQMALRVKWQRAEWVGDSSM